MLSNRGGAEGVTAAVANSWVDLCYVVSMLTSNGNVVVLLVETQLRNN